MKYLIELKFNSGVHFGSDYAGYGKENVQGYAHSDTIFSAIINSLVLVKNEYDHLQWVKDFFSSEQEDQKVPPFHLSSFGFVDTSPPEHRFYLPKPFAKPDYLTNNDAEYYYIKEFKRRKYISIETFYDWQNKIPLDIENIVEKEQEEFWIEGLRTQHLTDNITAATQIYQTGFIYYHDFVRPFFIVDIDESQMSFEDFMKLMRVVKFSGLGGRKTSGSGVFEVTADGWFRIDDNTIEDHQKINPNYSINKNAGRILLDKIFNAEMKWVYLFSTLYPQKITETDIHSINIIPRKGWIFSSVSASQLKRKTCYMISEGTVLKHNIPGKLVDVTPSEFKDHKVYRYGLPFYIPFCEVKHD